MKLLLVSPPFGEKGQKSKGLPIGPPVMEYMTGLTNMVRPDVEVQVIDANKEGFDPAAAEADLIGFTVLTPQAPWVYRTADELRSLGKKVLLGGMHVTALPSEAAKQVHDSRSLTERNFYSGLSQLRLLEGANSASGPRQYAFIPSGTHPSLITRFQKFCMFAPATVSGAEW